MFPRHCPCGFFVADHPPQRACRV